MLRLKTTEYCTVAMCCKDYLQLGAELKREWGQKPRIQPIPQAVETEFVDESQSLGGPEKAGSVLLYVSRETYCANENIIENGYGGVVSDFLMQNHRVFVLADMASIQFT